MKKEQLVKLVADKVAAQGAEDVQVPELTAELIIAGASVAMVNRELNKALEAAGVKVEKRVNSASDEIKALRKEITDSAYGMDFSDYAELEAEAEELSTKHDVPVKRVIKEMREVAKKDEIELPKKGNLGGVKKAIIDYFRINSDNDDTSIKDLADYLWDNTDIKSKEDALRMARQQYSFAVALINTAK